MFIQQHDIFERERNGNERGVVLLDVFQKQEGECHQFQTFSSFSYVTLKIRVRCHVEAYHAPCVILYSVF